MNQSRVAWIVALNALLSAAVHAHEIQEKGRPEKPAGTIVFFAEDRPTVLTVTVHIDEKPIRQVWHDYLGGLFRRFDADHDSLLNHKEQESFLAVTGILSSVTGSRQLFQWELPTEQTDWTVERFADYVASNLGPSVNIVTQSSGQAANLAFVNKSLFARLDTNDDKKLSAKEFASHERLLRCDWDEDESLSRMEINSVVLNVPRRNEPANRQIETSIRFESLDNAYTSSAFIQKLLDKYDRISVHDNAPSASRDFMLSSEELGVPPARLQHFDQDANGNLDVVELRQYWKNPVSFSHVHVNIGNESSMKFVRANAAAQGETDLVSRFHSNLLVLGPPKEGWLHDGKTYAQQEFARLDRDNNEYLERREIAVLEKQIPFSLYDLDHDMKIYLPEFTEVVTEQVMLAQSRVTLVVSGIQSSLFELIDVNSDDKLSRAEVSRIAEFVPAMDLNQDESISYDELPNIWTLRLDSLQNLISMPEMVAARNAPAELTSATSSNVPKWFSYMDRNHDRLVSKREFIGKAIDFERLDSNSDGILNAREVAER